MLQETVLAYLLRANRPLTCTDVTVILRNVYSEEEVQKALYALTENGRIQCKIHENQQVYVALLRARTEVTDGIIEAMIDFDAKAYSYKFALINEPLALNVAMDRLKAITAGPPTMSACAEMDELDKFMTSTVDKLQRLLHATNNITTDTLKRCYDSIQ